MVWRGLQWTGWLMFYGGLVYFVIWRASVAVLYDDLCV